MRIPTSEEISNAIEEYNKSHNLGDCICEPLGESLMNAKGLRDKEEKVVLLLMQDPMLACAIMLKLGVEIGLRCSEKWGKESVN